MNEGLVLIVSTKVDLATDTVVERLVSRGVPFHRINTEDFPFEDTLSCYPSSGQCHRPWLTHNGKALPDPASIWYRRLRTPGTPAGMDEGVAAFCRQEARAALLGGMLGRHGRWMSHPAAIWQAEFKPWQLQLAGSLGLATPRTVVTNDPCAIRDAFDEFGSMIVKPVRSGYVVNEGVGCAIYTSRILADHLDDLESARWAPSIYQELIPKRYDLRVTFVGGRCFAAAIDSPSDPAALIDWRHTENPDLPHHRIDLPAGLEESLHRLMQALGLAFGAIDLVQTPDGEYVFLEVNPSGQWLWLDDKVDLGISDAVAGWLGGDHQDMSRNRRDMMWWLIDRVFPLSQPLTAEERKANADRRAAQEKEWEARAAGLDGDELKEYVAVCKAALDDERQRQQSVDARLTTIIGLSSIAATIAFGAVLTNVPRVPGALYGFILLLLGYVILQLVSAMLAAVRGLERRTYDAFPLTDLLPGGEARSHFLRRQLLQWFSNLVRHQDQNDAKVTQMAVAHEAFKNFVAGLLIFALLAGAYQVVTPPGDDLVNRLKADQVLRDLLRGPEGPQGQPGIQGPQGEMGPAGAGANQEPPADAKTP